MKDSLSHELPREEECSCWDLSEGGWRGCPTALGCKVARRLQLQRSATTTAIIRDTQLVELSSPLWAQDNEYSRRYYSEETLLWTEFRGKPRISFYGRRFFSRAPNIGFRKDTRVSLEVEREGKPRFVTNGCKTGELCCTYERNEKYQIRNTCIQYGKRHIHTCTYIHILLKWSHRVNFLIPIATGQEFVKLLNHSFTWIFEREFTLKTDFVNIHYLETIKIKFH